MRMPVHLDSQMTFEIRIMRRCERVAGAQSALDIDNQLLESIIDLRNR